MDGYRAPRSFNEMRFRAPNVAERFVPRPRVTALLQQAARRPTILVTGPAGTGKTLAVADWDRATGRARTAWLCLDRSDAATERFWVSLVSALTVAAPDAMASAAPPAEPEADFLQRVVALNGGRLRIIIDDLHRIDGGSALDWLEDLVNWPPVGLQLVLLTRHEPPFPLQRLQLAEKISDVRSSHLAFDEQEADQLLRSGGVSLGRDALSELTRSTGGWAAALRLACLTLEISGDPDQVIDTFGGLGFNISQYLWDEVLELLPPDFGEFLLRTSVSERLCAPLASAISGKPDADLMLEALAQAQLLAHEVTDSGWFHTHPLLTRVLRARLHTTSPDTASQAHRGAAQWFEANGSPIQALEHAIASADADLIGAVALRTGVKTVLSSDRDHFADLLATLPVAATGSPELIVAQALSASFGRATVQPTAAIELAEAAVAKLPEPRQAVSGGVLELLRARRSFSDCDGPALLGHAVAARERLGTVGDTDFPTWELLQTAALISQGLGELWAGPPRAAAEVLDVALRRPGYSTTSKSHALSASGAMAVALSHEGRIALAASAADQALGVPEAPGAAARHHLQWAWLARSEAELESASLEQSRRSQGRCRSVAGDRLHPFVDIALGISTGRRLLRTGELDGAERALGQATDALAAHPGLPALRPSLVAAQVDLWLARDEAGRCVPFLSPHGEDTLIGEAPPVVNARARVQLAVGCGEQVRATVAPLLNGHGVPTVEAWLAVAAAEDHQRHDTRAAEATAKALAVAAQDGVRLPFLRPGNQLASSLRRHLEVRGTNRELAEWSLSTGRSARVPGPRPAALTDRECAVLLYLQTMASNAEIACSLNVSENTVKQHLKSIYRKLSVNTRRDAVRTARASGLLDGLD